MNIPDTTTGTLLDSSTFDGDKNQSNYNKYEDGNPTQTTALDGAGHKPQPPPLSTPGWESASSPRSPATRAASTSPPEPA